MKKQAAKKLIMMVGLPRSGKSTIAKSLGFPVVCPDAIRLALHGVVFLERAEPMVWCIAKIMVRALFSAGHDTVVLDACNHTRARRVEWRDLSWQRVYQFTELGWTITKHAGVKRLWGIHDRAPEDHFMLETCLDRAAKDGRGDLIPVIHRMYSAMESIGIDEDDWSEPKTTQAPCQESIGPPPDGAYTL